MQERWEPTQLTKVKALSGLIIMLIVVLVIAFSMAVVNIDADKVGIVKKKFGGGKLLSGRFIAANRENGYQAQTLSPGWHFFYWPWQYDIEKVPVIEIKSGFVGLVLATDGLPLPGDAIYAPKWKDPQQMIRAEYFLTKGQGYKGPQLDVLEPGVHPLNTKLFKVTPVPVTNVPAGSVAVIKSNVGDIVEAKGSLVPEGYRGIWDKPLIPQEYYLNTKAYEVTIISTRQVKVSYTTKIERGERGTSQETTPITVRSKDGYTFPVELRITYLIKREDAPGIVATIGDDGMVLDKLVTPTVRAIFKNNAEKVKALEYVQKRSVQQEQSAAMLKEELAEYGVTILAVLIDDVGDEKSLGELLKTQTDREIAIQEQVTFAEQQRAAEKQKELTKTRQEAKEEERLATAAYNVKIASENKQKLITEAQAEAEQIKLVAKAKADAYKLVSEVIGPDNAALLEIMKLVADGKIRITPEVMVGGGSQGGSGVTDALMGTVLRDMLSKKKDK